MIIGNGLIANLFKKDDIENVVFFASGVSNSLETHQSAFLREETLLRKTLKENPHKIFIYFSTCSIYDSSKNGSPYIHHKLRMEQIVKEFSLNFLILRVSNAVGKGGNPNLLMNYLINSVKEEKTINVHTLASRNLIDSEDVKNITLDLIKAGVLNKIINVAYLENFSTTEILGVLEKFFHKKSKRKLTKSGQNYLISIPEVETYFTKNQLTNKETYLCKMLVRYYS
jgi:nucleoside-diphosphate-sugar epimerase